MRTGVGPPPKFHNKLQVCERVPSRVRVNTSLVRQAKEVTSWTPLHLCRLLLMWRETRWPMLCLLWSQLTIGLPAFPRYENILTLSVWNQTNSQKDFYTAASQPKQRMNSFLSGFESHHDTKPLCDLWSTEPIMAAIVAAVNILSLILAAILLW